MSNFDHLSADESAPDPIGRLADEFVERFRRGERPPLTEYTEKYPEYAERIRKVFPMLVMMEQVGSTDGGSASGPRIPHRTTELRQVGDYRILRLIGRGGMGEVYEAEQLTLGRRVALKILPMRDPKDDRALARFRREARSAARLHHTNIVPVFEVGQDRDICYYAMQLIQGQGLDEVIQELVRLRKDSQTIPMARGKDASISRKLLSGEFRIPAAEDPVIGEDPKIPATPQKEPHSSAVLPGERDLSSVHSDLSHYFQSVARIGQQMASALAYAHARGIIHRDIKPSNILLDTAGIAWVTDFGLAKTEDHGLTSSGDLVGTLRYMAPERFRGECDSRADVYSVGLTIYEMVTLRAAFDVPDYLRLIDQVKTLDPVRPRSVDPRIPRDLETIIQKAIDKDPKRRYQSADALSEDFRRFIHDEPIKARQISSTERLIRWARHNQRVAGLLVMLAVVLTGGFIGVAWKWREAVTEREAKDQQRIRAEIALTKVEAEQLKTQEAQLRVEKALYSSNVVRARLEHLSGDLLGSEQSLERCPPEYRGWEWNFLKSLNNADLMTLSGHTGFVEAVTVSPDGKFIASAGGGNPYWQNKGAKTLPGEVFLWDFRSGKLLRKFEGHQNIANLVAFSHNGKFLASGGLDNTIRIWDVDSGREVRKIDAVPRSISFHPDNQRLAVTLRSGTAGLWMINNKTPMLQVPRQPNEYMAIAFSPDCESLAVTSGIQSAGPIQIRNPVTGEIRVSLEGAPASRGSFTYSPDSRVLTGLFSDGIRFWDVGTGLQKSGNPIVGNRIAISGDGRVATTANDGLLIVHDLSIPNRVVQLRGHTTAILSMTFTPDGQQVLTGGSDGKVKVWDATRDPLYSAVVDSKVFIGNSEAVAFDEQSRVLVAVGDRLKTIDPVLDRVVDTKRIKITSEWQSPSQQVCIDPDGRWVVGVAAEDRKLACCSEIASGQESVVLCGHTKEIFHTTLSRGAKRIATGTWRSITKGSTAEVKVWDGSNGVPLFEIAEPETGITRLALNDAGNLLAIASVTKVPSDAGPDAELHWKIRVYSLPDPTSTDTDDKSNLLWSDTGTGDSIEGLAFSPDSGRLAAVSQQGNVRIWKLSDPKQIIQHAGTGQSIMDVTFSPDGKRLAVAGRQMFKLLDSSTGEDLLVLRTEIQKNWVSIGANPRICFSADGTKIAALCGDSLSVWSGAEFGESTRAARRLEAERRAAARNSSKSD